MTHHRPLNRRVRRTSWYGLLAVVLGVVTSIVSAFGLTSNFAGEASVGDQSAEQRSTSKPATLRHDPSNPSLNLWGGDDRAASAPGLWDDPRPEYSLSRITAPARFILPVSFEMVRNGASRAPPSV